MANPCIISKPVKNPAEHIVRNVDAAVVNAYAAQMRKEGRKIRVTKCFNGYRGVGAKRVKIYVHQCFVYPETK